MRGNGALARASSLVAAVLVILPAGLTAVTAGPASAAARCTNLAPGTRIADVPWAQRRMAPERLAPLADGTGVNVAVIDSGVDADHPQLRGRVRQGADFLDTSRSNGKLDCVGHGTGVASIIAAGPPPAGVKFRGLAPEVKIIPIRVSEQQTIEGEVQGRTASVSQFAEAIRWAVDQGDADVINLSVVLIRDEPEVRAAIEHALAEDVVVVAAAGNAQGKGNPRPYPAAYEGVLGVGAIGPNSVRQDYSQVGDHVDLVAPGGEITVAWPDGKYSVQAGTSYAAPFVTAAAALVRQYRPSLKASEVVRRLVATADPAPGTKDAYGAGVVNPYRALTETLAAGAPAKAQPLPADTVDPAAQAAERRRAQTRRQSLLLAAGGGGAAVLVLVLALVLPRGARRRWRPAGPTPS